MTTNTIFSISTLIPQQVPGFVRDDHDTFILFLQAYYEYLEQSNTAWNSANTVHYGKVVNRAKNFLDYLDIDTTIDAFSEKIYKEFLSLIPNDISMNKKIFLKNAKDFYRSRGSQKSFEFIFRAMYGLDAEFYLPKTDILIPSSGKWIIEKSLRVSSIEIDGVETTNISDMVRFTNTLITGEDSGATAFVERVFGFYQNGQQIFEFFISNQEGIFTQGEMISATNIDGEELTATLFTGFVQSITVTVPGTSYNVGDPVTFTSNSGTGATAIVSDVSEGNVSAANVVIRGAGFRVNDVIQFSGGGGTGANGIVLEVIGTANSFYHPNTYNVNYDIILPYANTLLNVANYGFPFFANANANTALSDALSFFSFSPTGPMSIIQITSGGSGYISLPTADVVGNTLIKSMGVIATFTINNAGLNYANGDYLIFTNVPGGSGYGANAKVLSVNANGSIERVYVEPVAGEITGGAGYNPSYLPTITISSVSGTGANITVAALLGYGSPMTSIQVITGTIGTIEGITVTDLGQNYTDAPTVDLSGYGDGTAQATANIVTGIFSYPGRFKDDTGFLSSANYLQDRDYFQNFSYVIKVRKSIEDYRILIKELLHPAGTKVWGEYLFQSSGIMGNVISSTNSVNRLETIYTANSISFENTSTYLYKTTKLTGTSNGMVGTLSFWLSPNTMPTSNTSNIILFSITNTTSDIIKVGAYIGNTAIGLGSNNFIGIIGYDTTGNVALHIRTNTSTPLISNNYVHVLSSWNLSNTSQTHLYLTNVKSLNVVTLSANANLIYNLANITIASNMSNTAHFDGCLSEFWFNTEYVDFSNVTNRNKFISTSLLPENLGNNGNTPTSSSPLIYLKGNTTSFNVNYGTGGDFITLGTLQNCISSPSNR